MTNAQKTEPTAELAIQIVELTAEALDAARLPPNSCIVVARIVIDVLDSLGFQASALPVCAIAFSPSAAAAIDRGLPIEDVIARYPAAGAGISRFGSSPGTGMYDGHLLVRSGDLYIDATAGQFANAPRKIRMVPHVFHAPEFGNAGFTYVEPDSCSLIAYLPRADLSFRLTPGWSRTTTSTVIAAEVARAVAGQNRQRLATDRRTDAA